MRRTPNLTYLQDAKTAARRDINAHRSLPAKAPVKLVTVGSKWKDVSESGTDTKYHFIVLT